MTTVETGYRLEHEPDSTSWTARENLVDILERELLGPANGPEEILEGAPDAAYLIGRIAPARLLDGDGDPGEEGADEAATDVGDAVAARQVRGVPVADNDDAGAGADEDSGAAGSSALEDAPQQRGLMIPASMGLRCQVPADLAELTVLAEWGVYKSIRAEPDTDNTARRRRYQRTPVAVPVTLRLAVGRSTVSLVDDVVLRVDVRADGPDRRIVELALCNDRVAPRVIPVDAWLYQTRLTVTGDGQPVFLPVRDVLAAPSPEEDPELRRLELQYRDRLEFAVGRTCSVDWTQAPGTRHASTVWTTWLPVCETPPTTAEEVPGALLDMVELAKAEPAELRAGLAPIVDAYTGWLDEQQERIAGLPEHLHADAEELVHEARQVAAQLAGGLEHLLTDPEALRCFRFMNTVMADQRIQSQVAERRTTGPGESLADARAAVLARTDQPPHSWRTFQLAFVLMQLPMLTDPAAPRRSGTVARAQLLFFPTGGGKTEAYLGLAAYTFAIRRRQGVMTSADGPLDGRAGLAVLMRYTLRLLTAQQFQRATTLVCAAEMERRRDRATWGDEPFRIGLWVGTDVSPKRFDEAKQQLERANSGGGYRLTVLQIQRCPWCGTRIEPRDLRTDDQRRRVHIYCGDELGECPFAQGGTVECGLPVLTVDEEIYRLAPAFVIATVDKFARLAREGEAAALFGHVRRRCDRHGYVHPDYKNCTIAVGNKHPKSTDTVREVARLRPPDLVVQDELHLITGSLGTTVGLFEVAIDVAAGWTDAAGRSVRPLLVASTATARNAPDQVRSLYGRNVTIFPPQVLDAGKTFFGTEQPITAASPGRRYLGISTTGVRLTTAEIRVSEILLAGGQLLLDRCGAVADPYLTLVGYFSATRELAGMARYLGDDVQTAVQKGRRWSKLPKRYGTEFGLHVAELTSRIASADIAARLDQMAVPFDPAIDSTAGRSTLIELLKAGKKPPRREVNPFDAVLATSMLQVGVDVTRLGLMLVVGQPKNTAEYIQASSRVGRGASKPGLVVTLGNWARPRDLAHFEQFRHYHETFYAQVEALSVTPFSLTSLRRGLDGVLVSAARVLQAPLGLSPEGGAGRIGDEIPFLDKLIDTLVERVRIASGDDMAARAHAGLQNRRDQWVNRRSFLTSSGRALVYDRVTDQGSAGALMLSPEHAKQLIRTTDFPPFIVANSMREVQPEINLLVSPLVENLYLPDPPGAPGWRPRTNDEDSP